VGKSLERKKKVEEIDDVERKRRFISLHNTKSSSFGGTPE